jgi:lycopene beta-cyclase
LTYLQFHAVFILPPLLLLLPLARRAGTRLGGRGSWAYPAIAPIALLYTTPWDNYLVASGIWAYPPERILATIGYVPVEEYAFFVLQPLLTGAFFTWVLCRWLERGQRNDGAGLSRPAIAGTGTVVRGHGELGLWRTGGALVFIALALLGAWLLTIERGRYMGLILVWASPVLLVMWLFIGRRIARVRVPVVLGIGIPTAYLWVADAIAIRLGIWSISERFTLGWSPLGLPVEEAVFFLITNILVVVGVSLFLLPGLAVGSAPGSSEPRTGGEP